MNVNAAFEWKCQPRAEKLLLDFLEECISKNPAIGELQSDLLKTTSTRLFDWIDHFVVGNYPELEQELVEIGFVAQHATPAYRVFHHPGAQFPRLVVKDHPHPLEGVAISVESIDDFLMVRGRMGHIEGSALSGYRRCRISTENEITLWVVERRGDDTMEPTDTDSQLVELYIEAREQWLTRPRSGEDDDEAIILTLQLAEDLVLAMGQNRAAWVVLECERRYWQARNRAVRFKKTGKIV